MVLWLNIYLRYARYAHYDPYFSYVRLGLVGMDCDGFSYCNNAIWCVLYGFLSWRGRECFKHYGGVYIILVGLGFRSVLVNHHSLYAVIPIYVLALYGVRLFIVDYAHCILWGLGVLVG